MAEVRIVERSRRVVRARELRRDSTRAEALLWNVLRGRRLGGWRWRRQAPFGPSYLDFLSAEAGLVVELDGAQHAEQVAYDARRTAYLERAGLRVLRFWNHEVVEGRDDVCRTILEACGPLPPRREAERRGRGLGEGGAELAAIQAALRERATTSPGPARGAIKVASMPRRPLPTLSLSATRGERRCCRDARH
jgi:adenine-specific DNA-methyltransferase